MTNETLRLIALSDLEPHPLNANVMSAELRTKLAENIRRTHRYPPPVVRPLPTGKFQTLDGEQRCAVLRDLGEETAWCYVWPCDDHQALILLSTLNRLEGQDVPARRAALIAELQAHESLAELAKLLPETEVELGETLALLDMDVDALLEQLTAESARTEADLPVLFSFAVPPDEAPAVKEVLEGIERDIEGKNRRGRALVILARAYAAAPKGAE